MKKSILICFLFIQAASFLHSQDLFAAIRKGDLAEIDALIKKNPALVNSRNESDFTPLIIAAYRNQVKAVEFLLNHQADVNAPSPEGPALLGASYKGNLEITELLLNHRADVNAQNSQGTSALMYAVQSGNAALVKLLLAHGAKKDLAEKSGRTALSMAQAGNSEEMIALLSGK